MLRAQLKIREMQEGPIIGTGNGTDRHIKGDRRKAAGVYRGVPPGSKFKT